MRPRVTNLPDAAAILNANPADGLELWSPEHAAEIQGVQWFAMLQRAVWAEYPDRRATIVLDCGSRGDLAIEAFRLGLKAAVLRADGDVTNKVAEIAETFGGRLYTPSHPSLPKCSHSPLENRTD